MKILTKVPPMRLTARNLSARRGEDLVFEGISFDLGTRQALVLTGPNGSGKSTLLRVVAGLLPAETGRVDWTSDAAESGMRVAEACHYLGHRNAMKAELSVHENLSFWKGLFGRAHSGKGMTPADAAEAIGLGGITHLPFGYLSAGQQRRMAFAKLLVAHRPVWLLDEPTAAMDAGAEAVFTDLIKAHLVQGGIVMAATHQPLGLDGAKNLRMTGFADVAEGGW